MRTAIIIVTLVAVMGCGVQWEHSSHKSPYTGRKMQMGGFWGDTPSYYFVITHTITEHRTVDGKLEERRRRWTRTVQVTEEEYNKSRLPRVN